MAVQVENSSGEIRNCLVFFLSTWAILRDPATSAFDEQRSAYAPVLES